MDSKTEGRFFALLGFALGLFGIFAPYRWPKMSSAITSVCLLFAFGFVLAAIYLLVPKTWINIIITPARRLKRMWLIVGMIIGGLIFIYCAITYFSDLNVEHQNKQPIPQETKQRPTLYELFKTDFSDTFRVTEKYTATIDEVKVDIIAQIYDNSFSRTRFMGFYIPHSDHTYQICVLISNEYKKILDKLASVFNVTNIIPGESAGTTSNELVFSRRIYIYHDTDLSLQQKASIEQLFKSKELSVIFRGTDFKVASWLTIETTKQLKGR